MGRGDEIPGRNLTDKPDLPEIKENPSDATREWNVKVGSRPETPLSPEERAERQLVEGFSDSIGRGFDKLPTTQNVRDWYNQLSQADKDALRDPTAIVVLNSFASHTGDAEYNLELTKKSAEAVKSILKKEFGVKADIKVNPLGYDQDMPKGDDHLDRQVQVDILPGEQSAYGSDHTPDVQAPERAKSDHTPDASAPERDKSERSEKPVTLDKKESGRAKDIAESHKKNIERNTLVEIGKLTKEYQEIPMSLSRLGKQTAEMTGMESVLNIFSEELNEGKSDHIQKGKPYSVEEFKNRLSRDDVRSLERDMDICIAADRTAGKDLENGYRKAVDLINRILRLGHTPEERQFALNQIIDTSLHLIIVNRSQRLGLIKNERDGKTLDLNK